MITGFNAVLTIQKYRNTNLKVNLMLNDRHFPMKIRKSFVFV